MKRSFIILLGLCTIVTTVLHAQQSCLRAIVRSPHSVELHWCQGISEINFYGSLLQRRNDTEPTFSDVIGSFCPGATPVPPRECDYIDTTVFPGTWYYRIKRIDLDGSVTHSESTAVVVRSMLTQTFYPMEIGDRWDYLDYPDLGLGAIDTVNRVVLGDTTIDGRNYRVSHSRSFRYHIQWFSFERIDSVGDLYALNNGAEQLAFRFSDTSRTPWGNAIRLKRWQRNFVDTLYGRPRHILFAISYQPWDTLGTFAMGTYFAEGIGMTANLTPEVGGYRLRGARIAGTVYGTITSVDDGTTGGVPSEFALLQNYPNPFNPVTTIRFTVPVTVGTGPAGIALAGRHALSLRVYDVLGREVATLVNEQKSPGTYTVTWDASNQSSGVYLYQLRAGGFVQTKKMIIIQ